MSHFDHHTGMSQTSDHELISEADSHGDCQCTCSQTTMSEKYTDESSELSRPDTCHALDEPEDWSETSEMDCLSEHAWASHNEVLVDPDPDHGHAYDQCDHLHWQGVSMTDDDTIEIITSGSYDNYPHEVYYIDPVVAQTLFSDILLHRQQTANFHIHVEAKTKRQKFIARAVMLISCVMLIVSVLLVMISLIMSDHIDDLVRSANTFLVQPTDVSVAMTTEMTNFNSSTPTMIDNG